MMNGLTEMSIGKLGAMVAFVGMIGGGGYKTFELISDDGNWKGVVSTHIENIREDIGRIENTQNDIRKDIKELLQRVPAK